MKNNKKIKILLLTALMLVSTGIVSAKEYTPNEIPTSTYIIGNYMFTRDTNQKYDGKLTTKMIMLASKTIDTNNLNNMLIYYKTPAGVWKNALTGNTIETPNKFNISMENMEYNITLKYGDLNKDGNVNSTDLIILNRYVSSNKITDGAEILNGDVNDDGKVTEADLILLRKYVAGGYYEDKNLPNESLGTSYQIDYVLDDGTDLYKTDYELKNYKLTKPTNPKKTGYIFEGWYTESEFENEFDFENTNITKNLTLYAKFKKINYGDLNKDGNINSTDLIILNRYVSSNIITDGAEILNGDVNDDGKVTEADLILLRKYVAGGYYEDTNLPTEALGTSYEIEYLIDNTSSIDTYKTDYELKNYKLTKPTNPKKTGYIFEGWYTEPELENKFDFENTKITKNLTLFAKFKKVNYGDVNNDGSIKIVDLILLKRYIIGGYEMPEGAEPMNGDVNNDGKLTEADVILLSRYIAGGYYTDTNLPTEPLGTSYEITYSIDTDLYQTDYQLKNYKITKPEDPIKEDYIFEGWYTEPELENKFDFENTTITKNITLFAKFVHIQYGDVNGDGQVTGQDVVRLNKYLDENIEFDENELKRSDINADGIVDELDLKIIKYLLASHDYDSEPTVEPYDTVLFKGDLNGDGEVTGKDVIRLKKYLAGTIDLNKKQLKCADYNGDNQVTAADKTALIQAIANHDYEEEPVFYGDIISLS